MYHFKTTIEVEVEVSFDIEPGQRGFRNSLGGPEEPDLAPEIIDLDIKYPENIPEDIQENIIDECFELLKD